jgi:uncharacterized protein YecE (DUF72 family)
LALDAHGGAGMTIIGTAGWSIPRGVGDRCPAPGQHLERYGRVFRGAEINSSFYRWHAPATYAKWARLTPDPFQFAVKMPRLITHDLRLRRVRLPLERFLGEIAGLGQKCGPLLVQLPPSFEFDCRVANTFFDLLRARHAGPVACEPRHPSWFTRVANACLVARQVARVATDPTSISGADSPGAWPGLIYYRLHGSPRKYWSRYTAEYIGALARSLAQGPPEVAAWCIFDNTASGAALENAWELSESVFAGSDRRRS